MRIPMLGRVRLLAGGILRGAPHIVPPGSALGRIAGFWVRVLHLFLQNRGPVRAAALAYTTLLALVPLLAISFSVAALFLPREEHQRREQLLEWIEFGVARAAPALGLSSEDGKVQRALVAANIVSFVERIHFKTIGAAASLGLLLLVLGLLRAVETAFNDIWDVPRGRNSGRSLVYYWAAITLGPVVLLGAKVANYLPHVPAGVPGVLASLIAFAVMPLGMFLAFSGLYYLMPNTRVRWHAALAGGAVAAVLWTLNNKLAALYNTRVLTASAIYGALGVLPIFLAGMYLSWVIVLFGAQVASALQHRTRAEDLWRSGGVPTGDDTQGALQLMTRVGARFAAGADPPGADELREELALPGARTEALLERLIEGRLLHAIEGYPTRYAPARPLANITAWDILEALRERGQGGGPVSGDSRVHAALESIRAACGETARSITLAALVTPPATQSRVARETRAAGAP
ncbi:MAG: YihY family inner membrane protein [Verrucomicrobiae bacterium]|nr:YihY family inner membrane protein [Verrucomicrobiae bacterium]